ncbi:MAG: autotransporter [Phycisphaerales bacterium]|nr:autotransporter [Phycisphaerales bacterium]
MTFADSRLRFPFRRPTAAAAAAVAAVLAPPTFAPAAATVTWNGGGGDLAWSTPGNWAGGTAPVAGDTADFSVAGTVVLPAANDVITVGAPASLAQLHIGGTTPSFRLAGQPITLTGATGIKREGTAAGSALTHTIGNDLVLGANTTFSVGNGGGRVTVNGVVGEVGGSRSFTKGDSSDLQLNGNNTFTGAVVLNNGLTVVGHANALGAGTGIVLLNNTTNTATADVRIANGITFARDVLVRSNTNANTVAGDELGGVVTTVSNVWAGNVYLNRRVSLTGGTGSGVTDFTGAIADATAATPGVGANAYNSSDVTKIAAGRVRLSAANTYSGATTVSAGALLVNGSLSANDAAVTVLTGATLGGTGTINRPVAVNAGGTLAAGDGGPGTLTVASGKTLSLLDGSVLAAELAAAAGGSDQVVVPTAAFTPAGSGAGTLNVRLLAAAAPADPAATYTLLRWTGDDPASLPALAADPASAYSATLGFVGAGDGLPGGSLVASNVVPEPSRLGGLLLTGLLVVRRRRWR